MYHQRQDNQMGGGQFNDTRRYTKIFVGGLAWETQRDTMKSYFEQFGEILEAVVITDKYTGRSKGYGFVTFKDADSAIRACQNPSPVIDGRRANCNLASLGANNASRQQQFAGTGRYSSAPEFVAPPAYHDSSLSSSLYYPPYTFPYSTAAYGYNPGYSQDTMYPMNYWNSPVYGAQHYYYNNINNNITGASRPPATGGFYLYTPPPPLIYSNDYTQQPHNSVHYPQMLQYPPTYYPRHYSSGILSLPSSMPITTTTTTTTVTITSADTPTEVSGRQNRAGVAAAIGKDVVKEATSATSQVNETIKEPNTTS